MDNKVDHHAFSPSYPDAPPLYDTAGGPSTPSRRGETMVSVGQISIDHRSKDNITGSYQINPRSNQLQGFWGSGKTPNAYFGTHKGAINLTLSTGSTSDLLEPVDVQAGSRGGNITIHLTSMAPNTPINLQAGSRRGHITVFVPREYCGSIQLSTLFGTLNVLPGLAALARIEKPVGWKQILHLGGARDSLSPSYCELYARHAYVTVGLLGVDQYTPPVGFWGNLGGRFGSKDSERDEEDSDHNDAGLIPYPLKG